MIVHVCGKPYVDSFKVIWAQRRFTTLTCFDNCETLAAFREKFENKKDTQKNGLERCEIFFGNIVSRYRKIVNFPPLYYF